MVAIVKASMKRLQRINPQPDTHSLSVLSLSHIHTKSVQKHDRSHDGTGILFQEPNPTGSRPRDPSELCKQHTKPHRPNTQDRARPKRHKGCFRKPKDPKSAAPISSKKACFRKPKDPKSAREQEGGVDGIIDCGAGQWPQLCTNLRVMIF